VDTPLPLYLVGPFADRGAFRFDEKGFGAREVTRVSDAGTFPPDGATPGWVILSPDLADPVVVGLLRRMGRTPGPWSPLLLLEEREELEDREERQALERPEERENREPLEGVDPGEGVAEPRILPLSPGTSVTVETLQDRLREEDSRASLLSLRLLVAELARIRHDVNNPLTAALAEVQLLLMDQPGDSEEAESLRVVEAQLKRIRDLVAKLSAYRVSGW
jgi:signal transduction histidine kinase